MKKNALILGTLAIGLAFSSCNTDTPENGAFTKEQEKKIIEEINAEDVIEYNGQNQKAWGNYMATVGKLLVDDANALYDDWTKSYNGGKPYAEIFKEHKSEALKLNSAYDCLALLVTYMDHIADEVGSEKIGSPYRKYTEKWPTKTNMKAGLYAVESWYSWHSRLDYTNNILSIRNGYYGVYDKSFNKLSKAHANSLYAYVEKKDPALNKKVAQAIDKAIKAIDNIPQPFRNHINSSETKAAADAAADLNEVLAKDMQSFLDKNKNDHKALDPIVSHVVDEVIVPTYADLKKYNKELYRKILAFQAKPSNEGFEACCEAWIKARQPWESSEAYLFGPVSDKGLDPNMDTWPLDIDGIENILKSEDWNKLNWNGDFVEEEEGDNGNSQLSPEEKKRAESISSAQSLRGYHTIEFLIFKNGKPRKIK